MHLLVDMDDTIVQWGAAKDRELRARYPGLTGFLYGDLQTGWDMNEGLDVAHVAALRALMDSPDFYANMDPFPGAKAALNQMLLEGHEVTIVSTPWATNPTCLRDKYEWLEKHIGPGWGDRAIFTRDKTAIRGDVLFDDKPLIKGKYTPTWKQVIVDQPHNRHVTEAVRIGTIQRWKEALILLGVGSPNLAPFLGLGGAKTAGKDAFADALVEQFGAIKMGMSDPLLDALLTLNPMIPVEESHEWFRVKDLVDNIGYVEAKKNSEVRALLQRLGTEVGRDMLGENVWVDLAARRITEARQQGRPVIMTSIRFPNEIQMVRDLGGDLVYITRPGVEASGHLSETAVSAEDFDEVINNAGDLNDLELIAELFGLSCGWDER